MSDAKKQSVKCKYNHRWTETNDQISCSRCGALPTSKQIEQAEAEVRLRSWVKPGDTLYTQIKSVSRSGMSRTIQVIKIECSNGQPQMSYLGWNIAKALGDKYDREREGVKIGGCGMDMGFALVYNLSQHLFGDGYKCLGKGKCPSNYHANHRSMLNCPNNCYFDQEKAIRIYRDGTEQRECTTCQQGYVPNPEPEKFNLVHKDGYAVSQKWL